MEANIFRLVCFQTPFQQQCLRGLFWLLRERENLISPLLRGGRRRISSSAFLSRRTFGYYLPIGSYGTISAAKWSSNGGLEASVSK